MDTGDTRPRALMNKLKFEKGVDIESMPFSNTERNNLTLPIAASKMATHHCLR